jgi:hypothetical protein
VSAPPFNTHEQCPSPRGTTTDRTGASWLLGVA